MPKRADLWRPLQVLRIPDFYAEPHRTELNKTNSRLYSSGTLPDMQRAVV